jgi:hypothetical protein
MKLEQFSTGSVRDTQEGKPRYSLIPPKPLERVAHHFTMGANKYGDFNWHKGQNTSRIIDSLMRHVENYRKGMKDEDHLAAIIVNAMFIMEFEGTELDDIYDWSKKSWVK